MALRLRASSCRRKTEEKGLPPSDPGKSLVCLSVSGACQCVSDKVGKWVGPQDGPVKKGPSVPTRSKWAQEFAWEG